MDRGGCRRGYCALRSCIIAWRRGAWFSPLLYKVIKTASFSIEDGRDSDSGVLATEIVVSMDSHLARATLRTAFLALENSVEVKCDHLLQQLVR